MLAQARERHMESQAHSIVDQVRSKARSFGQHVVTETQAEAIRFKQELEHQAQEVLASATEAVSQAEARSRDTEAQARQEARKLQFRLGGARQALSDSHDQTRLLQSQVQQLQTEKGQLMARLESIEALFASRTPVPSHATPRQEPASTRQHYPHMSFSQDHASQNAAVQPKDERFDPLSFSRASQPAEQAAERAVQPVRLQALLEGAACGVQVLGRECSSTAQPVSVLPQEKSTWARDSISLAMDPNLQRLQHQRGLFRVRTLSLVRRR